MDQCCLLCQTPGTELSSTPTHRPMMSYQAACWWFWQTAKTGATHLCQGRPVAQGGIHRVYSHPRCLWNHTQTRKLFTKRLRTHYSQGYTLRLHCTSWLLRLCQSGGTKGSKYNCCNTVGPEPKWPTLDLRGQQPKIQKKMKTFQWINMLWFI